MRRAVERLPPLNLFRILAHAESAMRPLQRFGASVLGELSLDPYLRELAILRVAARRDAEYEWIQHVPIAQDLGMDEAHLEALKATDTASGSSNVFSVPELAVVRFTDQVLADGKVEAEIFQQVYELLDARRVVELLLAIGLYQMLGQVMTAVEIDLDEAAGREVIESSLPRPGTDAGRRRAG